MLYLQNATFSAHSLCPFHLSSVPNSRVFVSHSYMAWLVKVKKSISTSFNNSLSAAPSITNKHANNTIIKQSNTSPIGILAFEMSGLISKLIHLWQSLSDHNMIRLRNESISLQGIHQIISANESFLLSLACAEMVQNLRVIRNSLSTLSKKCNDPILIDFDRFFVEFCNTGHDPYNWALSWKEMEANIKQMDQYVTTTVSLRRQMQELSSVENGLKKSLQCKEHEDKIMIKQQQVLWQRHEVKYKKEKSIWNKSFDTIVLLLARSVFTLLARIKLVFGIGNSNFLLCCPSAAVYTSDSYPVIDPFIMASEQLIKESAELGEDSKEFCGSFELNLKILEPPTSTLGAAALALHYANLIIVIEKMIRTPHLIGFDAREDLYAMLPQSIRRSLRIRLKRLGFSAIDQVLAGQWRDAMGNIMQWLSPLAHNMVKWQSERSFEQQNMTPKTTVLLLQTLYFANQDKTEAAITELLVGLNYIWTFEREMYAKALLDCSDFSGLFNLQNSSG